MAERPKRKRIFRLTLSTGILIGLVLGILCGLFFGEWCAWLDIVGKAYIRLLQMSILPYMMVSLIGGIGSLGATKAIRLALTAGVVLLASWLLAFLFVFLTPFSFRDVLRASRAALITGFVTGNLFIVLPLLIENGKALFGERGMRSDDTDSFIEVLIPVSFNFPNLGKLLTLMFVMFAGWYTGNNVAVANYPMFSLMGLLSLFGGVNLAVPFLLDQMRIPSDMYQLYVVTGVVNGWFATLLAVMNLFAFTLIATCAATGTLKIKKRQSLAFAAASAGVVLVMLIGARAAFTAMLGDTDLTHKTLMQMRLDSEIEAKVFADEAPPEIDVDPTKSRLPQIVEREMLRVGYHPDMFPFCFFNEAGDLVGLDVALMHDLAKGLGVRLEFVPWDHGTLGEELDSGEIDVVIGGLFVTAERLAKMSLSNAYMTVTVGIVVEDHRRDEFATLEMIKEIDGLKLGVLGVRTADKVHTELPNVEVVPLDSPRQFFEKPRPSDDLMRFAAVIGRR